MRKTSLTTKTDWMSIGLHHGCWHWLPDILRYALCSADIFGRSFLDLIFEMLLNVNCETNNTVNGAVHSDEVVALIHFFLFLSMLSTLIKQFVSCLLENTRTLVSTYFGMTLLIFCKNKHKIELFRKLSIAILFPWTIHNLIFQMEQTTLTEIGWIRMLLLFLRKIFLVKKTLIIILEIWISIEKGFLWGK